MARLNRSAAAPLLTTSLVALFATGCGSTAIETQTAADEPASYAARVPASTHGNPAPSKSVPYVAAPERISRFASGFATEWLSYDSRREGPRAVLQRVRPFVTPTLLTRFRDSGRVRIAWQPLAAREERVRFTSPAVSWQPSPSTRTPPPVTVTVTGTLLTTSAVATLRTPEAITLRLAPTRPGLKITSVHGGGA